ncbi:MAG TPA: DUF4394 domain-containing protein [Pyrinomonadaceae bacterium]|jgi:dipeptidyl aminopeptidase/acylaminoacyl peptidase
MNKRENLTRRAAVWLALVCLVAQAASPAFVNTAAARVRPRQQKPARADEDHTQTPRGRVAYAADLEDNFEIYVANPEGGAITKVTDDPAEDTDPSWSGDGNRLAFVSDRDGNQEIYLVGSAGGLETRLTTNAAADLDPAFSPDGSKIAFTSERDGNQNVYVMHADGTNVVRLTDAAGADFRPAWSPDGSKLAFTSDRDGDDEIYLMNADGSGQTNLSNNAADDLNPDWSSGRITFQSTRDGDDEIYSMDVVGLGQTRLTTSASFDGRPARSFDGSRVYFVSNRDGNLELYLMNSDGSGLQRLTETEGSEFDPDVQPLTAAAPNATFQFSPTSYTADEGAGRVTVTVTRAGNTGAAAQVDFATVSGTASERSDFTPIVVTVEFAAGETSKTVDVPLIDDAFVEADETFTVTLGNATGATLGASFSATVTVIDNDSATPASAATLYGVTGANTLVRFGSTSPGTIERTVTVTGLQGGETVVGIDARPATRQLYALGSAGRLYVVNPTSGRAALISTVSTALSGTSFGVDFNPTVDRLRVVSDADQNLRINVDTGAATADGGLAYAAGDANAGQNPNVVGSAYTNSVAGATTTTLYGIDSARDVLVVQNPPNNGTLNTVGALGVDASDAVGFDIAPNGNTAFAALNVGGASQLYTINLTTGAATLFGGVGGGAQLRGLAVFNPSPNPIDDDEFFVRQQYLDFLSREPDSGGLQFWTNELNRLISTCPTTPADNRAACILGARAQISTAFFLSIEFQETGYFVIRVYLEAFGRLPTFREFLEDMQDVRRGVIIGQEGALERLAANRREFLDRFVDGEEFRARHSGESNADYVNALFTNAGVPPSSEAATRDALVTGLNNGTETRATALQKVADTRSVFNAAYNRAFVLMEYFGYLRRDPDAAGYRFWLDKLESVSIPGEDVRNPDVALARIRRAQMVEAFIDSVEYRQRFGQP